MHVLDPDRERAPRGESAHELPPGVQELVVALVLPEPRERAARADARRVREPFAGAAAFGRIVDRLGDERVEGLLTAVAQEQLAQRCERADLAARAAACGEHAHRGPGRHEFLDEPRLPLAGRSRDEHQHGPRRRAPLREPEELEL